MALQWRRWHWLGLWPKMVCISTLCLPPIDRFSLLILTVRTIVVSAPIIGTTSLEKLEDLLGM